jgi:putative FmdB family regulatory protein
MPTYEYECSACKHTFEEFQGIKAEPLKKCPKCGKAKLQRLIGTGGGIMFKGSGFYQTDYRSDAYKKASEADKPAAAKTDEKPAAKPSAEPAKPAAEPAAKPAAKETKDSGGGKSGEKKS